MQITQICSDLASPGLLLDERTYAEPTGERRLNRNYQSVASRGVARYVGMMQSAFYGPAWAETQLAPEIEYDETISPEWRQAMADRLYVRDVGLMGLLESGHLAMTGNSRPVGFRSNIGGSLKNLLVIGDTLIHLTDDFALKVFNFRRYVTQRDSSTAVLKHIIEEFIDPLSLSVQQIEKARLKIGDLEKADVADRIHTINTRTQWNPRTKVWVVCQEVNGKEITERQEQVTSFISTPFELVPGEHYGRGFVEQNLGDLESLDEMGLRLLQMGELATRINPIISPGSSITPEMYQRSVSGQCLSDDVRAGQAQNIALLQTQKGADFTIGYQNVQRLESNLGKAFLIVSETAPSGESGRSPVAWRNASKEVDDSTSGIGSMVSDEQQYGLICKTAEIAERLGLIDPIKDYTDPRTGKKRKTVRLVTLTGERALTRQQKIQSVLSIAQIMQQLGPEATSRIDVGILARVIARYGGLLDEPGLIKSDEKVKAEMAEKMRMETAMAANQQAIQSIGTIAEQAAAAQTQGAIQQNLPQ